MVREGVSCNWLVGQNELFKSTKLHSSEIDPANHILVLGNPPVDNVQFDGFIKTPLM